MANLNAAGSSKPSDDVGNKKPVEETKEKVKPKKTKKEKSKIEDDGDDINEETNAVGESDRGSIKVDMHNNKCFCCSCIVNKTGKRKGNKPDSKWNGLDSC